MNNNNNPQPPLIPATGQEYDVAAYNAMPIADLIVRFQALNGPSVNKIRDMG
jgi:hypothetical protein